MPRNQFQRMIFARSNSEIEHESVLDAHSAGQLEVNI